MSKRFISAKVKIDIDRKGAFEIDRGTALIRYWSQSWPKSVTGRKSTQLVRSTSNPTVVRTKTRIRWENERLERWSAVKGRKSIMSITIPRITTVRTLNVFLVKRIDKKVLRKLILRDDPITPKPWSLHCKLNKHDKLRSNPSLETGDKRVLQLYMCILWKTLWF